MGDVSSVAVTEPVFTPRLSVTRSLDSASANRAAQGSQGGPVKIAKRDSSTSTPDMGSM